MVRDKKIIKDRLVKDFDYPTTGAELLADKLIAIDDKIWEIFAAWWEYGKEPEITIQNYSFDQLIHDYSMKPLAAFLTLDWLLREPDKAISSLNKGYDSIKKK